MVAYPVPVDFELRIHNFLDMRISRVLYLTYHILSAYPNNMPKPFFNIPVIKSLPFDERMRLISTITKLFNWDSYINTHSCYSSGVTLIRALSSPELDLRTNSFDDDETVTDVDNFCDNPNGLALDDYLGGNRFLIKLRQLKRAKDLKQVLKEQDYDKGTVFPTELDLQRLQSIILSDAERNLQS